MSQISFDVNKSGTLKKGNPEVAKKLNRVIRPMTPDTSFGTTTTALSRRQSSRTKRDRRRRRLNLIIISLFFCGLIVPIQLFIGPLRLSPYRIILLVLFIPSLIAYFSGRSGKVRLPDVLIFLYAIWASIALFRIHGLKAVEPAGIHFVETVGSYLLARCYIRSAVDFHNMIRILFFFIVILLPFTFFESLTGRNILTETLGAVFTVPQRWDIEGRLGLERAMGSFEHPILYGVFCAGALGLVFYGLGHGRISTANFLRSGLVALATFFSLSTGPLVALMSQIYLTGWDIITRRIQGRWTILCGLVIAAYVTVDLISNRSPVEVFISYLTFNPHNAYNRVWIWHFGTAEVLRNPIFGIGLNEWQRAFWMSGSMDNFWLVKAVRYGLPALGFLVAGVIALGTSLARLRSRDRRVQNYRKGWFITIISLAIAGSTVHYWNAVYCLFMFLIGSGVWMLDSAPAKKTL